MCYMQTHKRHCNTKYMFTMFRPHSERWTSATHNWKQSRVSQGGPQTEEQASPLPHKSLSPKP